MSYRTTGILLSCTEGGPFLERADKPHSSFCLSFYSSYAYLSYRKSMNISESKDQTITVSVCVSPAHCHHEDREGRLGRTRKIRRHGWRGIAL
jgi:hypothetical protein